MTEALRITAILGGAMGAALVGASFSLAQESAGRQPLVNTAAELNAEEAPRAIDFNDPHAAFGGAANQMSLTLSNANAPRFQQPETASEHTSEDGRRFELELAANAERAGVPLDVAFAHRASIGADSNGDIDQRGRGSEVRIGRGLVQQREPGPNGRSIYVFVAADDEALTWRPGARAQGAGPSVALEDRVEVGDMSAGITYERNGVQASLAYVEREVSAQVGRENFARDERFAGVTVTMRR